MHSVGIPILYCVVYMLYAGYHVNDACNIVINIYICMGKSNYI